IQTPNPLLIQPDQTRLQLAVLAIPHNHPRRQLIGVIERRHLRLAPIVSNLPLKLLLQRRLDRKPYAQAPDLIQRAQPVFKPLQVWGPLLFIDEYLVGQPVPAKSQANDQGGQTNPGPAILSRTLTRG